MAEADGGWETWRWDETLFAGASEYYEQGRIPYAPGLPDVLADECKLDGRGRLLDVGCGPGTIALRVAHLFEEVVGLDPDPGMIGAARLAAAREGVVNGRWVRARAEDLPSGLGRFRVIAFAASFHWMDRPKVAAVVREMLDRVGVVVQIHAPGYGVDELLAMGLPHPPPPSDALERIRHRWLGADKRAGQSIRNTSPSGEDDVFQVAGFSPCRAVVIADGRVIDRTIDEIVANLFSSSGTAPHLLGDRVAEFEEEVRVELSEASPSGMFSARLPDNSLRIWTAMTHQ